jgi:putative ABC transport system permease protein
MNRAGFILANALRNRRRTILTVASLGASVFLLTTLEGLLRHMSTSQEKTGSATRVIVRRKTSLQDRLPQSYLEKVKALEGVRAVTPMIWFGGIYKEFKPEYMFGQLSCDPETFREVIPEAEIVDLETGKPIQSQDGHDPYDDFKADRRGAIASRELFQKFHWKIGDTITLQGIIYPVSLELNLRAAYHAKEGTDNQTLYYHQKYIDESLGSPGLIGVVSVRATDADVVPSLISRIDGKFENSDFETLTETERSFQLGFLKMMGNITYLIRSITTAVAITMLLVAANTTAMAARERAYEIGVMKAIGFPIQSVLGLLIAEATLVGFVGSAIGVGLAYAAAPAVNWLGQLSFMSYFLYGYTLNPVVAGSALAIGTLVTLVAALFPCWRVSSLPISATIRRAA